MRRVKCFSILLVLMLLFCSCNLEQDEIISRYESESETLNSEGKDIDESANNLRVEETKLSESQYKDWIVASFKGYINSDDFEYRIPDIDEILYPIVTGIESEEILEDINQQIIESIFTEQNLSRPIERVQMANTPFSHVKNPSYIIINNVVSIPVVIYWSGEKSTYKCYSITIDLLSGERLYLNDIISVGEEMVTSILYDDSFYNDYEIGIEQNMSDYLKNYYDVEKKDKEVVVQHMLSDLISSDNGMTEAYYLTKNALVLCVYSNDGVPREIIIPKENLDNLIILDMWK